MTTDGRLDQAAASARAHLLDARTAGGWWEGELSSSALSTATASFALQQALEAASQLEPQRERAVIDAVSERQARRQVSAGLAWLALHQNADGGWGDTVLSKSNISTTALCWAAFSADAQALHPAYPNVSAAAERWLTSAAGGCDPAHLVPAIIARYGKDRTFSVPILTMCALSGRLGKGRAAWRHVPALPFELAAFPQRWFKFLRLPVVSYALPALIAIGQLRHAVAPTRQPVTRALRTLTRRRTLRLLSKIQPTSGGFLEAIPLTSFVLMSLIGAGQVENEVVRNGLRFLVASARPDGSWPIDTNLATWVTTLAVNALAISPDFREALPAPQRRAIADWLLRQQYVQEHPYTLADPGGWAWTPLAGGVPDADDTPGALLALRHLARAGEPDESAIISQAAIAGVQWLLDLQNGDGGIPTFCRGWGTLPFDRSSADLTAHALRALAGWKDASAPKLRQRIESATARGIGFLMDAQQRDGSWLPLWFGNQHAPDDINPTYGSARVLLASAAGEPLGAAWAQRVSRAVDWLLAAQRPGGGWGAGGDTPPSIEETAISVEALAYLALNLPPGDAVTLVDAGKIRAAIDHGVAWLLTATDSGTRFDPSPIGFYFARLWYFERLYPVIFTVAAFESARLVTLAEQRGSAAPRH